MNVFSLLTQMSVAEARSRAVKLLSDLIASGLNKKPEDRTEDEELAIKVSLLGAAGLVVSV